MRDTFFAAVRRLLATRAYLDGAFFNVALPEVERLDRSALRELAASGKRAVLSGHGFIAARRTDWVAAGGWDNTRAHYGPDDTEARVQLQRIGLKRLDGPPILVAHIWWLSAPRGDSARHEIRANTEPLTRLRLTDSGFTDKHWDVTQGHAKIALCVPHSPERPRFFDLRSLLALNSELADVTVVLWDGETQPPDWIAQDGCDIIAARAGPRWNDYANRLTLAARALLHGANWLLFLDDDMTLPNQTRETLRAQALEADASGAVAVSYKLREMWDMRRYRCDGPIWPNKRFPVLCKNPLYARTANWHEEHLKPLHAIPRLAGPCVDQGFEVLHWGMATPELRAARHARWRALDPRNVLQPIGYDYMIDETGLKLCEPISIGRLPERASQQPSQPAPA